MIDQEKAITVLGDTVCRACSKTFGTGVQCPSCRTLWQTQQPLFAPDRLAAQTPEVRDALSRLEKYELPAGVISRLAEKPPYDAMTPQQILQRVIEFKKFVALLVINHKKNRKVDMVSNEIDEIWHTFILFTKEYEEFCRTLVGEYIHHVPNVESDRTDLSAIGNYPKQAARDFVDDYQKYFGELDPVWQTNLADEIRKQQEADRVRKKKLATLAVVLALNATLVAFLVRELAAGGYAVAFVYTATAYLPLLVGGILWSRLGKDPYNRRMAAIVVMATFAALLGTAVIFAIQCKIDSGTRTGIIVGFSVLFAVASGTFACLRQKGRVKSGIRSSGGAGCGSAVYVSCSGGGGGGCGGGGCGGC